jgi:hypothetical protein
MPVRPLPSNPNLDHLRYQARDLLKEHASRTPGSAQRIREFHPRFAGATDAEIFDAALTLSAAQLTIAREHGFESWPRLKRRVEQPAQADGSSGPIHERIEDAELRQAVDLLDAGDAAGLRLYLAQHPDLVHRRAIFEGGNYFRNPSLLEFIAENPVRHGTLPANIVEVARVVLDAGAGAEARDEALGLVATGRVPRECGVQERLIDLLCAAGADPQMAVRSAAGHGEFAAVEALLRNGAKLDLPVAAALGRTGEFQRLLPRSSSQDRHLGLALASQFGHVEIVRLLLDAGEDPNRYNPVGGHSHSMPLHQAAFGGHKELVRLLVERGGRLDMKDILWQGTPAGWAEYGGKIEIAEYLKAEAETRKIRGNG